MRTAHGGLGALGAGDSTHYRANGNGQRNREQQESRYNLKQGFHVTRIGQLIILRHMVCHRFSPCY